LDGVVINWIKKETLEFEKGILKEKGYPNVGFCCNLIFEQTSDHQNLDYESHYFTTTEERFSKTKECKVYKIVDLE
jgi:hypothetical protein